MKEVRKKNILLQHARLERGWTQQHLAQLLGVEVQTVRSWERGSRVPSLEVRPRLCSMLGKTFAELGFPPSAPGLASAAEPVAEQLPGQVVQNVYEASHGESDAVNSHPVQQALVQRISYIGLRQDDENRYRMLRRIQSRWISGVLDRLMSAPLIPLDLQMRPDAVAHPWYAEIQDVSPTSSAMFPAGTSIVDVYDAAGGELLILGEPGAGKTVLLLELTRELVRRAQLDDAQPMPVIFHLSSWADKRPVFEDWLAQELNTKYQVPVRLAQQWVLAGQILPLLDGLDEVEQSALPACVAAINSYRQRHGFVPMVVCCRSSVYDALPSRLVLENAVVVQPLTTRQIENYISDRGESGERLAAMRTALQADADLREIVSTPLMLSILAYSTQGMSQEEVHALPASPHIVLELYVQRLLQRASKRANKHSSKYRPEETRRWLAWLAWQMVQHNQTEFYIERMQPDWIEDNRQRHQYKRTVMRIMMIIQCIVGGGLVAWLKGGLKNGVVGSGNGIFGLFGGGPGNSMLGWMSPGIGGGNQGGASLILMLAVVTWLVTILVGSPSLPNLTPRAIWHGLVSGLRSGLKLGIPGSVVAILFFGALGGMQHGLSYGLGIGSFLGIAVGLMSGLGAGLRYGQDEQEKPKEMAVFADRLIDGLILGAGGGLSFLVVEELLQVSQRSTLIYSTIVFLFFFCAYGFGGWPDLFSSLVQTIKPVEKVSWSWTQMLRDTRVNGKRSILVALVTCLSVSIVIGCISSFFFLDMSYGLHYGLVFGTMSGLIVGIAAMLVSSITSGWSSDILPEDHHTKPNEGIARSGYNALLGACFFAPIGGLASGLACGIGFGLIGGLPTWPVMAKAFGVMFFIVFFMLFAIAQGGIAWIEHYVLRWYLWRSGALPRKYVDFLQAASDYALVRKVGGSYMFAHHLILEYFARQYQSARGDRS